ncbi:MAG: DUF2989 domain-containing protein, partial [Colwellia sp.]|nr:DUF2989 domain-containing protein [Colwellia sp.]
MKLLTLFFALLLLSSCNGNKSLAELCKENPKICQEFGQDSWCKRERNNVALARIDLKTINKDPQKYNLLIAYEDYVACMGLAS